MTKSKSARKSLVLVPAGTAETLPAQPPVSDFSTLVATFVAQMGGRRSKADTLFDAQNLVYDAWESPDRKRRIALAKKALSLSEECADAHSLLAEHLSKSVEELVAGYRRAVAAGQRALGKRSFKEDVGEFWGLIETRPYMRALCNLGQALWNTGSDANRAEGVDHYWELLRLNPTDNQGVRDLLMPCLIVLDRDKDAERLFKVYKGYAMAPWVFARAMLDYRANGDTPAAVAALKKAIAYNPHVAAYLLGQRKLPRSLPEYVGYGDVNEAVAYADGSQEGWRRTPGALQWLVARSGGGEARVARTKRGSGSGQRGKRRS